MILAIDTSAGQCAVALAGRDGVKSRAKHLARGHAEHLFPMIDDLTGGNYSRLTKIVVCTGPGSFTGLRIGVAAARGLALGSGSSVLGVSRFEALAYGQRRVTVVLAGRGETRYLQSFADGIAIGPPDIGPLPEDGGLVGDGLPGSVEEDGLVDPRVLVTIGESRDAGLPPAPLYLRDAAAEPPREPPPVILDP
ncbi:MAG: tRNA (adenosine(37)-N6)-threonylcarbamoyltransferase complex dimerization subunit type 1 TsaB [Pseudomonadota bacterium]